MDSQFEFEQEFRDEIPVVEKEEVTPEQTETPPGEDFNDSTPAESVRQKQFSFSIGFFILCVAVLFALIELIRTIVYFFG